MEIEIKFDGLPLWNFDNLEFLEKFVVFAPPRFNKVIVRDNVTIVLWDDGTKTRSTCAPDDTFDPVIGLAQCLLKKVYGKRKIASLVKRIQYQNDSSKAKTGKGK
jgi:hypothetical protein